jgi:hypothetical protein
MNRTYRLLSHLTPFILFLVVWPNVSFAQTSVARPISRYNVTVMPESADGSAFGWIELFRHEQS